MHDSINVRDRKDSKPWREWSQKRLTRVQRTLTNYEMFMARFGTTHGCARKTETVDFFWLPEQRKIGKDSLHDVFVWHHLYDGLDNEPTNMINTWRSNFMTCWPFSNLIQHNGSHKRHSVFLSFLRTSSDSTPFEQYVSWIQSFWFLLHLYPSSLTTG